MQVTSGPAAEFISTSSKDAPIAAYMNDLFRQAARRGASDVHFDDQESDCLVRFRLRGELQEEGRLTLAIGREVDRKIRSRCGFSLIETQAPQDGKFEMSVDGRNVEFRVSILPLARGQADGVEWRRPPRRGSNQRVARARGCCELAPPHAPRSTTGKSEHR